MPTDASSRSTPVPGSDLGLRTERHGTRLDVGIVAAVPEGLDDLTHLDEVADAIAVLAADQRAEHPDIELRLVADHPPEATHPLPDAVAERLGLTEQRDLLQLRRALPVAADDPARPRRDDGPDPAFGDLRLRTFDPATDAAAWVRANNRAFADHPDQGAETEASLAATLAEAWVDLDGFLVIDDPRRPGELAGSCWTRVHPATGSDPALGEIFVIGVDPNFHGRGLGPALVLAGLDHLASVGLAEAMLYVDATNTPARTVYDRLGFRLHLRRRVSTAPAPNPGPSPTPTPSP